MALMIIGSTAGMVWMSARLGLAEQRARAERKHRASACARAYDAGFADALAAVVDALPSRACRPEPGAPGALAEEDGRVATGGAR